MPTLDKIFVPYTVVVIWTFLVISRCIRCSKLTWHLLVVAKDFIFDSFFFIAAQHFRLFYPFCICVYKGTYIFVLAEVFLTWHHSPSFPFVLCVFRSACPLCKWDILLSDILLHILKIVRIFETCKFCLLEKIVEILVNL